MEPLFPCPIERLSILKMISKGFQILKVNLLQPIDLQKSKDLDCSPNRAKTAKYPSLPGAEDAGLTRAFHRARRSTQDCLMKHLKQTINSHSDQP